jgi:hypothetical protein
MKRLLKKVIDAIRDVPRKVDPTRDIDLFKEVVWLVQATDEEQFNLWEKYAHDSDHRVHKDICIKWEQRNPGHSVTLGHLDGRPICVSVAYNYLNGKLVMFYDGTSQLVDWKMIDEWIEYHAEKCLGWEKTWETWPHVNAANFATCFRVIGVGKKG